MHACMHSASEVHLCALGQSHVDKAPATRGWAARRAGGAQPSAEGALAGVSSFAYQGTNSHAVMTGPCAAPARLARPGQLWQRRRYWFQVGALGTALPHEHGAHDLHHLHAQHYRMFACYFSANVPCLLMLTSSRFLRYLTLSSLDNTWDS